MNSTFDKSLDDESIVVLGSSSLKSLENSVSQKNHADSEEMSDLHEFVKLDFNEGELNGNHSQFSFDKTSKNLVKIEDEPSLGSIMIASNIVSSSSSAELQNKLANILDENNLLRETLKENNSSIKEQFKTIVSWRDDVMKTYALHKNKFAETKELIEKLKKENIQQKNELDTMKSFMLCQYNGNSSQKIDTSSYEELVDSSSVVILTDRLEVIEKDKRKILHENEDLRWQKDSLQNIVDNNIKEIRELKIKLDIAESLIKENIQQKNELDTMKSFMVCQYNGNSSQKIDTSSYEELVNSSSVDIMTDRLEVIEKDKRKILHENENLCRQKDSLQNIVDNNIKEIQELKIKLDIAESNELTFKNSTKLLETKIANIQEELKAAQYKMSESENFKIEHSQYKQTTQNTIRHLKIEVQELKAKLKDAYTLTLQPLRFSLDLEENHDSEHYETFSKNIGIYDKILKDLSTDLNIYTTQFCTLLENLCALKDSLNLKGQELNEESKTIMNTINNQIDIHHKSLTQRNQKIKSSLTGFEKIFNDFQDIIKATKNNKVKLNDFAADLFKKNDELEEVKNELVNLRKLISTLQKDSDQLDLLKAQIEVYRSDFEVERKARTDIAAEKQSLVEQLRVLHISKQKLVEEFDVYRQSQGSSSSFQSQETPAAPVFTEVFPCPICQECFDSTDTLQEHANSCLDRNG